MKVFVTNSPILEPEAPPVPVSMTLHLIGGEVPASWAAQGVTGVGVFDLPDAPSFSAPAPEPELPPA